MALSEHERRQLEEMARTLEAEDTKFAARLSGKTSLRHLWPYALLGLLGFGLLILAVVVKQAWLGPVGYSVTMLSGWLGYRRLHPGAGSRD